MSSEICLKLPPLNVLCNFCEYVLIKYAIYSIYLLSVVFRGSWISNLCYSPKSPYVTVIICKYTFAITLTD